MMRNPWQKEGVSILEEKLSNVLPMVGQQRLFEKLSSFRKNISSSDPLKLSDFFMVIGAWGVGKSRVGHEICLQSIQPDREWIIDGQGQRIFEPGDERSILPIFVRYSQITNGELGSRLDADTWIPIATIEALKRLVGGSKAGGPGALAHNQDILNNHLRECLTPRGWETHKLELHEALQIQDPAVAMATVQRVLGKLGVQNLWIIVDEIEDITDIEREGLKTEERKEAGIDQVLLTVIPRVIKNEQTRQQYPWVNFTLLCSRAVGDLLKNVRAIERRTGWHELVTNSFDDVQSFFGYLEKNRTDIAAAINSYPPGLREAAFFAANRNFGWFNVIMYFAHDNYSGLDAAGVLERLARHAPVGSGRSIFNLDLIDTDYRVAHGDDWELVRRRLFGLLPEEIGYGTPAIVADALLRREDADGDRPIFSKYLEIDLKDPRSLPPFLARAGFRVVAGSANEYEMPGEVRFDLDVVIRSLAAFSIALPEARRGNLLVCEKLEDFIDQLKGLTPYADSADRFGGFLHAFLTEERWRVLGEDGAQRTHIGPSFSFLLDFNTLATAKATVSGYLLEGDANTRVAEAFKQAKNQKLERVNALLRGIACAWDGGQDFVTVSFVKDRRCPLVSWRPTADPLGFAVDHTAYLISVNQASFGDVESDLQHLAGLGAAPVLLIDEDDHDALQQLVLDLARSNPRMAPFIIPISLPRVASDTMTVLGLMGERGDATAAFTPDKLRTQQFHASIGTTLGLIKQTVTDWREQADQQGLILRPAFYGTSTNDELLRAFATGYASMLQGVDYTTMVGSDAHFAGDKELRDNFKKAAERNYKPGPAFEKAPITRMLLGKEDGTVAVAIPSALVALLKACLCATGLKPAELERRFLFDLRQREGDKKQHELQKPRDVLKHLLGVLLHLGLVHRDDKESHRGISERILRQEIADARGHLDGQIAGYIEKIRKQHEASADALKLRDKEARTRLKDSEQRLSKLDLKGIEAPWSELLKPSADDGRLVFQDRFAGAATAVKRIRDDTRWVFDRDQYDGVRYGPDTLQQLEEQQHNDHYPLWKRCKILNGFYEEVRTRRDTLLKEIKVKGDAFEARIPKLDDGKAMLPLQVLTTPLAITYQELDFSPDRPDKTIVAGSTALGTQSLGYALAKGNFQKSQQRLTELERLVKQPGGLVAEFDRLTSSWEGCCQTLQDCQNLLAQWSRFFAAATASVRTDFRIETLAKECAELEDYFQKGGIREVVDDREGSGTPARELLGILDNELQQHQAKPLELKERLEDVKNSILPRLQADFEKQHGHAFSAFRRICRVQGLAAPTLPQVVGDTWAATTKPFEDLAEGIQAQGTAFFKGSDLDFNGFVDLCRRADAKEPLDWTSEEMVRALTDLQRLKLIEYRFVEPEA